MVRLHCEKHREGKIDPEQQAIVQKCMVKSHPFKVSKNDPV